jgi:hypothetical protein
MSNILPKEDENCKGMLDIIHLLPIHPPNVRQEPRHAPSIWEEKRKRRVRTHKLIIKATWDLSLILQA